MFELFNDLPLGVLKPVAEPPEYRRCKRKAVDDRVWIRSTRAAARALLLDLSADGALLEADLALEPGTAVHLRCFFDDGEGPFGVWASVVRVGPRRGGRHRIGVRFNYLRRPDRRRLRAYLEQRRIDRSWHAQYGF